MSTVVLVISDTHVGGSTAIAPPKFEIHTGRKDETQLVEASKAQQWLWTCFTDLAEYAKQLAGVRGKTRKHRLVFIHLGDVVEGIHHGSVQLMNEIQDQISAACDLLRPITSLADVSYLTYGTGAHNGGAAEAEVSIGQELGMRHGWEFSLNIDGVTLDITHHGRAGQRDWTGSAAGLAVEVARDYQKCNLPAPRYILRGHVHKIDDSGWKLPDTRALMLPSWQLRTVHGYKVAANSKRADVGGLIIDTANPASPDGSRLRYEAPGGFIHTETV